MNSLRTPGWLIRSCVAIVFVMVAIVGGGSAFGANPVR